MRNLKKVISSVAALAIVASSASAFAVTFPDVDASASYNEAVKVLSGLKIVEGDDNGLFNPDKTVTRAEFTKMAVGALGEMASAEAQATSKFDDAATTSVHWAAGFIAQGVADGFIDGYDDHRFGPDDTVTYAQACKMLVAAIGYTTYAEAAGGWPAGYVSQAASLGISKGVSSQNDVALTRAQCAVLINNTLDVPLNVIDGWKTEVGLTGAVQTPEFKKLDGKEDRDYQTLLTDRHKAYKVKGRVMANAKGSADGLKKDEVRYNVEVADRFDDANKGYSYNKNTYPAKQVMKVGDTNAADTLFAYTQAIVQKDEDADEFTIISIVNYGNSKTVEFKADDVADDDNTIEKTEYVKYAKIPVYKSSSTSSTTKYDLVKGSDDKAAAIMYVNGVEAGTVTNQMITDYILNNTTGTVTLVDKTDEGSTSTDGKYDYIMVDYFIDAVVDYVTTSSSKAKVYFKASESSANKMEWDIDDQDVDITFTKGDNQIAYTDLAEYDVLSIQYNVVDDQFTSQSLTDKKYYNVLVSTNKVTGSATSIDKDDDAVTIGGESYDLVTKIKTVDDFELGTEYDVYIDAFGYLAYSDEGNSDKNYGVVVAMYTSSGDDYPTVRMITSDAKVVAYECKDQGEANNFYNFAKGVNTGYVSPGFKKTDADVAARITNGETVCTYKLSGGKVKFDKDYTEKRNGGKDLEYKASSSKLGTYSISDATTKIIDMDEYMDPNNSGTSVKTLSLASFEDEANYDAWLFDKNTDSIYRFAIVFKGTSSIRPESQLAVVKASNGTKDVDSNTCNAYTVLREGNEVELLVDDIAGIPTLYEGDVVAYTLNSDGYVEKNNIYRLFTMGQTNNSEYAQLLADTLGYEEFNGMLNSAVVDDTVGDALAQKDKDKGALAIAFGGNTNKNKKVYAYFGIVYKKGTSNVELLTNQDSSGIADVNKATDFSLGGAKVYTFDFAERSAKGVRLSLGNSATQNTSIYNQAYVPGSDKNNVDFDELDGATPQLALIKEVDGDVTDAVFFVAP